MPNCYGCKTNFVKKDHSDRLCPGCRISLKIGNELRQMPVGHRLTRNKECFSINDPYCGMSWEGLTLNDAVSQWRCVAYCGAVEKIREEARNMKTVKLKIPFPKKVFCPDCKTQMKKAWIQCDDGSGFYCGWLCACKQDKRTSLSREKFDQIWKTLTLTERSAIKDKSEWEQMSTWSVLQEWPSLIPKRCRAILETKSPGKPG